MSANLIKTTKIFKCGNSFAVRLPRDLGLQGHQVTIFRESNGDVIIREVPKTLSGLMEKLNQFPSNLFNDREENVKFEEREDF